MQILKLEKSNYLLGVCHMLILLFVEFIKEFIAVKFEN